MPHAQLGGLGLCLHTKMPEFYRDWQETSVALFHACSSGGLNSMNRLRGMQTLVFDLQKIVTGQILVG